MKRQLPLYFLALLTLSSTSCKQTFACRCVVTDTTTNKQTESISVGTYSSFFGMKKQAKENCEVNKDAKTDEHVTCTLE